MFCRTLLLLVGLCRADKAVEAAGVKLQVKGQSGKMTITIPASNNTTQDLEIKMDALRQLDAAGNTLGGGGSEKHSFNSFATQEFTISEPVDEKYKDLSVAKVSFESVLVGSSKLTIDTYIFKQAGNFSVGEDTVSVSEGSVKFNVMLGEWSWCAAGGSCKAGDGDGASVELDIVAASGSDAPKKGSDSKTYSIGDATMLMLNTYSDDGGSTWKAMPEGYPKMDGSKFTLKFPKWEGSIIYDPVVTGASDSGSSDKDTDAACLAFPGLAALLWLVQ
jgi:hypothetical protein